MSIPTSHPLATRASRVVWFNSILEALVLSEDHLGYIQQLIYTSISDGSPFLSSTTLSPPSDNATTTAPIPELIVLLSKGDYINVFLHEAMYPVLMVLQKKMQKLVSMVKEDPTLPLQLNLINIFSQSLSEWLQQSRYDDDNNNNNQNDDIQRFEYRQFLLIILSIASISIFTQVNYSGLPIVLPVTLQQYRDNSAKIVPIKTSAPSLDDIDEGAENEDEDQESSDRQQSISTTTTTASIPLTTSTSEITNNITSPPSPILSLQSRVNLFFTLFSPKAVRDTAGIIELADKTKAGSGKNKKWINVEKKMLSNSAFKLNGEDAYHCSHFPLFLIIARSILGCEALLKDAMTTLLPTVEQFNPSLESIFVGEMKDHLENINNTDEEAIPTTPNLSLFGCPSLLTYALRAVKLHSEIILTPTATIRTEFYTLSLLYQLHYGILSSGEDPTTPPSPTSTPSCKHDTICSEFKCIPYKAFHLVYSNGLVEGKMNNNKITSRLISLFDTLTRLVELLPTIKFIDPLTGQDFLKSTTTALVGINQSGGGLSAANGQDIVPIATAGHSYYDAILLIAYNHFANAVSTITQSLEVDGAVKTAMESNVDDIHAVGISPLTHTHTHAAYKPIILFPTQQSSTPIPLTLSTTLFTTITIELASIALKLYLYKRSFLLLALSKVFSGLSIYVSGILGRRTRYQSRSFAQLHGISFLHKDIIKAIEFDSRNSHLVQYSTKIGTFEQISAKKASFDSISAIPAPKSLPPSTDSDDEIPPLESLPPSAIIPTAFIISTDITDSLAAQYVIQTADAEALIPKVIEETNEKFLREKEKYKGVINERNPTIPRVSKLSHTEFPSGVGSSGDGVGENETEVFALSVTRGGHVEDVPIDSIDDVYLTYMLPDSDNYNVDEATSKNLKNGTEVIDFENSDDNNGSASHDLTEDEKILVQAGGTLEGVVSLLATAKGSIVFEPNTAAINDDYTTKNALQHTEPPLEQFDPYMQTAIGSVLTLAVANYLYQTCPQNEITQQEQECYLQTIFMHRFNQGNHYLDAGKNKHGTNYTEYSSLFDFQSYSIPYQTIFASLMMRSVLEYPTSRLQVRSISQIELLTNIFVTADEKLATIQFRPQYLTEVVDLYHNIGIDSTTYNLDLRQVTKGNSPLLYLYNGISTPHHQFQRERPEFYAGLIDKTIRNLVKFRQNKVFTSSTTPWWEMLRTCADICTKAGYITSSLRCYVNVQLWSSVIDTLIKIGRRGDATKLLKHVLKVPKKATSGELFSELKESQQLELEYKTKLQREREEAEAKALVEAKERALNNPDGDNDDNDNVFGNSDDSYSVVMSDDAKSSGGYSISSTTSTSSTSTITPALSTMIPIMFQKGDFEDELDAEAKEKRSGKKKNDEHEEETSQDSDYREGSLLYFVAKAMESSIYTTTTASGLHTFSAASYRLYHLLGESTQDENYWSMAWELSNHTYAPPQRSLAKWLAVHKRNEESYIAYQNALALNGSDHQTWYECGVVATRLQQYNKAIPCFSNALRLKPDISEGWNNLAACHLYLQNTGSAYHALSQCLRTHSNSWKVWENFLQCSLQLGYFHDVIRSLTNISQLKGKIDPLTLLPIQYTTNQSKFHVYALYSTWFQYLQGQINTQIGSFIEQKIQIDADKAMKDALQGASDIPSTTPTPAQDPKSPHYCSLCVEIPVDPQLASLMTPGPTETWTYFPLVKNFVGAISSIMMNIQHNESREAQMGGMMRGGGDDAGAGNSIAAAMDFSRATQAPTGPTSQNEDGNAENIIESDEDDGDNNDDDEMMKQGRFLEVLSKTAKGQKCILHYLQALSTQNIAIQSDLTIIKQSSTQFESCIDILIKFLIENAYSETYTSHLDFIFTNLKHIVNNATFVDDHILRHHRDYVTEPLTSDDRTVANHKELAILLHDRLIDGMKRDYNNNKANLAHLLTYIDQLNASRDGLKALCAQDDELFKEYGGSGETAQVEEAYEYDPYGSYF